MSTLTQCRAGSSVYSVSLMPLENALMASGGLGGDGAGRWERNELWLLNAAEGFDLACSLSAGGIKVGECCNLVRMSLTLNSFAYRKIVN